MNQRSVNGYNQPAHNASIQPSIYLSIYPCVRGCLPEFCLCGRLSAPSVYEFLSRHGVRQQTLQ